MRRILNKYSKVITSSEDESEVNEARKSPQGETTFSREISKEQSGLSSHYSVCAYGRLVMNSFQNSNFSSHFKNSKTKMCFRPF